MKTTFMACLQCFAVLVLSQTVLAAPVSSGTSGELLLGRVEAVQRTFNFSVDACRANFRPTTSYTNLASNAQCDVKLYPVNASAILSSLTLNYPGRSMIDPGPDAAVLDLYATVAGIMPHGYSVYITRQCRGGGCFTTYPNGVPVLTSFDADVQAAVAKAITDVVPQGKLNVIVHLVR